jgi:hypothetical protein
MACPLQISAKTFGRNIVHDDTEGLCGTDSAALSHRTTREDAHAGVLPRLRQRVARPEPLGLPQSSAANCALTSSDSARKIFVRRPCWRVRNDSPGSVDRRELMLRVATIGMQRAWPAREKNFSSPMGARGWQPLKGSDSGPRAGSLASTGCPPRGPSPGSSARGKLRTTTLALIQPSVELDEYETRGLLRCALDEGLRTRRIIDDLPAPQEPETPMEIGRPWACVMISATVPATPPKFRNRDLCRHQAKCSVQPLAANTSRTSR